MSPLNGNERRYACMSVMSEYQQIRQKLDAAVTVVLGSEVADSLVEELKVSSMENVYNKYKPSGYERRYSLLEDKTYERSVSGATLTIHNNIKGNPAYDFGEGTWDPGEITDIIESGVGYHWGGIHAMEPYPRPFMEEALDMGIDDGSLETALQSGLNTLGF